MQLRVFQKCLVFQMCIKKENKTYLKHLTICGTLEGCETNIAKTQAITVLHYQFSAHTLQLAKPKISLTILMKKYFIYKRLIIFF